LKPTKKIIVIGGGFAGLQFVEHCNTSQFEILLIDQINHHQFQPLFYQVATSQVEPSSISFPFRKVFQRKKNVNIRLAKVQEIDSSNKKVITSIGDFEYDYLVIATGCKTNFFGNTELEKHALTLKSTSDAISIRNHILQNFERIISSTDAEKEALLNIIIVGAGPTGVELAGAFAEIKKKILPKDYPGIDFAKLNIILIEGAKHTLSTMSSNAQLASEKYLKDMGVELHTEVFVKNYDGVTVFLSNGKEFKTKNLIWAAGVTGNLIKGMNQEVISRGNRLKVNRFGLVDGYSDIYAIGDIAYMETPNYPNSHPQVANVAINQARNLARNLSRMLHNKPLKEFTYSDKGSMATIGKNKAVVDLPFFKFSGYFAWYIWMFLHLMLILSVRNKLVIFINWAWNYFTSDSSLRLIFSQKQNSDIK
jgi:NADH:ubiquinone reductase (H+-translocating)